ncbi:MAG: hypothetical protein KGJ06_05455, partial [Pseudomonadota bacterium]|nr:hypothetical protein [Pseudomonadota bacterium]
METELKNLEHFESYPDGTVKLRTLRRIDGSCDLSYYHPNGALAEESTFSPAGIPVARRIFSGSGCLMEEDFLDISHASPRRYYKIYYPETGHLKEEYHYIPNKDLEPPRPPVDAFKFLEYLRQRAIEEVTKNPFEPDLTYAHLMKGFDESQGKQAPLPDDRSELIGRAGDKKTIGTYTLRSYRAYYPNGNLKEETVYSWDRNTSRLTRLFNPDGSRTVETYNDEGNWHLRERFDNCNKCVEKLTYYQMIYADLSRKQPLYRPGNRIAVDADGTKRDESFHLYHNAETGES